MRALHTIVAISLTALGLMACDKGIPTAPKGTTLVVTANPVTIPNQNGTEQVPLTFTITATDADGTTPTYSMMNAPAGATLSAGGTFSFTPSYAQAGTYVVTFVASDGTAQDSQAVTITIANANRPPVLTVPGAQTVNEGATLSF